MDTPIINPLFDLLPFADLEARQNFNARVASLPDDEQTKNWIQRALHRCITNNYITEYTTLLPHFLPHRLSCGSLLDILAERERMEMFFHTWNRMETYDKFHSHLEQMYSKLLDKISHWSDLTCVRLLLASPTAQRLACVDFTNAVNNLFYSAARNDNTNLIVFLADYIDITAPSFDDNVYLFLIENKNTTALQALIPQFKQHKNRGNFVAFAWQDACDSKIMDVFELLLPLVGDEPLDYLRGDTRTSFEHYRATQQAARIEQTLSQQAVHASHRKI